MAGRLIMSGKRTKIPVDKIFISNYNIRKSQKLKDLDLLSKSIKDIGLINPITVIDRDGKYELVAGQRRFRAVRDYLKEREIDATILPPKTDETKSLIYSMSENLQKRPPSYLDYVKAAVMLYEKYREDVKKVADELNITFSRAMYFLRRRVVPEKVAKLVDRKQLTWSKAQQLAEAAWPDTNKIIELAYDLIKMPSTRQNRVIKAVKRKPKASTKEILALAESLPPTIRLRNIEISEGVYFSLKNYAKQTDTDINDIIEDALKEWLENRGEFD